MYGGVYEATSEPWHTSSLCVRYRERHVTNSITKGEKTHPLIPALRPEQGAAKWQFCVKLKETTQNYVRICALTPHSRHAPTYIVARLVPVSSSLSLFFFVCFFLSRGDLPSFKVKYCNSSLTEILHGEWEHAAHISQFNNNGSLRAYKTDETQEEAEGDMRRRRKEEEGGGGEC